MSKFTDGVKAALHFTDRLLGIEFQCDLPSGKCGGSPNAASIGYCGHVGPHGPHRADEQPTYDS